MTATPQDVLSALRQVKYPGYSRDIVSFGLIRDVEVGGLGTTITLVPPADAPDVVEQIRPEIERCLAGLQGLGTVRLAIEAPPKPQQAARGPKPLATVRHALAVASGKGGVGKSTVAVNLALAFRKLGATGLLDADVYGPSAPILLGIEDEKPFVTPDRRITPIETHGIRAISMGLFVERERPIIWRGPMVTKLIVEFLHNVEWGDLDYLVLDLPPGTGDVQLTLTQQLAMAGGIIVTTPQDVALADVRRGMKMFEQVSVPVLGVVENMSGYECPSCGHETHIFGAGGGERVAESLGVPLLGRIGLTGSVRELGDAGTPIVEALPDHPVSRQFDAIAAAVAKRLN